MYQQRTSRVSKLFDCIVRYFMLLMSTHTTKCNSLTVAFHIVDKWPLYKVSIVSMLLYVWPQVIPGSLNITTATSTRLRLDRPVHNMTHEALMLHEIEYWLRYELSSFGKILSIWTCLCHTWTLGSKIEFKIKKLFLFVSNSIVLHLEQRQMRL